MVTLICPCPPICSCLPPLFAGIHAVKDMSATGYESVHFETQDKYYALAACAALLKYVEHTHSMVFAARSLRMSFRGSNETAFIGERHCNVRDGNAQQQQARSPVDKA